MGFYYKAYVGFQTMGFSLLIVSTIISLAILILISGVPESRFERWYKGTHKIQRLPYLCLLYGCWAFLFAEIVKAPFQHGLELAAVQWAIFGACAVVVVIAGVSLIHKYEEVKWEEAAL